MVANKAFIHICATLKAKRVNHIKGIVIVLTSALQ